MGSVQWWASDVWNHFGWVGWTRPIWTPDPCYTQPLYSPNCSNFQAEINRIASENKAIQEKSLAQTISSVITTTTPTSTITTTISEPNSTSPSVSVVTTPTIASTNVVAVSSTSDTVSASLVIKPVVKIEMKNDNNLALSLIEKNKENETMLALNASKKAINEANTSASNSVKESLSIAEDNILKGKEVSNMAMKEAQVIAESSIVEQKQSSNNGLFELRVGPTFGFQPILPPQIFSFNQTQQGTIVTPTVQQNVESTMPQQYTPVIIAPPMTFITPESRPIITQVQTEQPVTTPTFANQNVESQQIYIPSSNVLPNVSTNQVAITSTISPTTQIEQLNPIVIANVQQNVEVRNILEEQSTTNNFLTNRANPLNEIVDSKPNINNNQSQTNNTQTVNKNASDNEVAGGVDISRMAVTPVGFNSYQLALRDVPFYAPKEIYRGQRTVDNARALRNLASDRLHQDMVDLQYRR